jgi:energy-converting hydrogenase Eha subunit G
MGCRIIGKRNFWESVMKTYTMALLAGVAIGAIALQGLHAQGAKLKAYSISEK